MASKTQVPVQNYGGPNRVERWYGTPTTQVYSGLSGSGVNNKVMHVFGPVAIPTVIDWVGFMADDTGVGDLRAVILRAADSKKLSDLISSHTNGDVLGSATDLADLTPFTPMYLDGLDDMSELDRTMQVGDRLVMLIADDAGDAGAAGLGFFALGRTVGPVPEPEVTSA